jgi:HD-GYP domain-containing protein (c-di-GMP phosphodiesterase class II)
MIGSLFRPLKEKWSKAPVLSRMGAEDYRQYQSDLQVLMDALALSGDVPRSVSGNLFAEAEDFFGMCLSLGDPMTVAALAPSFRPEDPSGAGGRILALRLKALLQLQRIEEIHGCLDRYGRLTPVPDPAFLHSCSARLALLERQPEALASGFRKALSAADGERRGSLYEEWIWSVLELADEGGAEFTDAQAALEAWAGETGTSAKSPELLWAKASLHAYQGDAAQARGILQHFGSGALPAASAARRHLLSARLALLEDRLADAEGSFRSAFQAGLDAGNAWVERGIAAAGASMMRLTSDEEAAKQFLRELTEAKDGYLEPGHSSRVEGLALRLAAGIGELRGDDRSLTTRPLGRAAQFHDIGKWFLPWCLLNRALPLLDPEQEQVRDHVPRGEALLRVWGESEAAGLAGEHHERSNGEGYPRGGAFSCPGSACLALAEAFVGACSATRKIPRPREAVSLLSEFKALRGLWFEPAAMDALLLAAGEDGGGIIRPGRRTP